MGSMMVSVSSRIDAACAKHRTLLERHLSSKHLFAKDAITLSDIDSLASLRYVDTEIRNWTAKDVVRFEKLCLKELLDRFLQGLGLTDRRFVSETMILMLQDIFDAEILLKDVSMTSVEIEQRINVVVQWYTELITQNEAYSKAKKALDEQLALHAKIGQGTKKIIPKNQTEGESITAKSTKGTSQSKISADYMQESQAELSTQPLPSIRMKQRALDRRATRNLYDVLANTDEQDEIKPDILKKPSGTRVDDNIGESFEPGPHSMKASLRTRSVTLPFRQQRALRPPAKVFQDNFGYGAPNWGPSKDGNAFSTLQIRSDRLKQPDSRSI